MPKISVLLPVHNGEKYLREAIESILNQTELDFEFLIIDDGSTDRTGDIARSFSDFRIRYEKRPKTGLIGTLNYGISIAQGTYIARMDADDRSLPQRFALQVSLMEQNPKIAVCGGWADKIDEDGKVFGTFSYPKLTTKEIRSFTFKHNPFIHPTVMVRKDVLVAVGGYRSFWKHIEDYELWTRIVPKFECMNIGQPILEYRMHAGQITSKKRVRMLFYGLLVRVMYVFRF